MRKIYRQRGRILVHGVTLCVGLRARIILLPAGVSFVCVCSIGEYTVFFLEELRALRVDFGGWCRSDCDGCSGVSIDLGGI